MTDGVAQWQRLMLPAAVLAESDGRRTPRDWVVDALMYAFSVGFGVLILASTTSYRSSLAVVLDVVFGVLAFVALFFRRTRPTEVAVLVIALSAFSGLAAAAALAACFNASLRMKNGRGVFAVAVFGCVCAAISAVSYGKADGYDLSGLLVGLLLTTVAIGWGLFARAQRDLVSSLHERAARLENERRLYAEQARDAERRRIAREMHDVLAHRLSLLSVHAGALEFRPDAPPEDIASAASVVRASAHSALQELREVIGVLREPDLEDTRPAETPSTRPATPSLDTATASPSRADTPPSDTETPRTVTPPTAGSPSGAETPGAVTPPTAGSPSGAETPGAVTPPTAASPSGAETPRPTTSPTAVDPSGVATPPATAPPASSLGARARRGAATPPAVIAPPAATPAGRRGGGADGTRFWAGPGERATDPPQPTLAEIPALVEESRAVGAKVGLRVAVAEAEAVPMALGRTAYRIVQEGLTNARKHAPASAVEVVVEGDQGKVVVSVVSRRPVGVVAAPPGAGALPGSGAGLIGLRERVAIAGGELEAGPDATGDFVLRAVLPWEPAA
jgi:signal transduction histidine kinase